LYPARQLFILAYNPSIMNFRTLIVLLLCVCYARSSRADYRNYYQLVNKAESTFVYSRDSQCFQLYDAAFRRVPQPLLKDVYIAAEIAYFLHDSPRFLHYIDLAFRNGLPLSSVPSAPFMRHIGQSGIYPSMRSLYDQAQPAVHIDAAARDSVWLRCYASDSTKKGMARDPQRRQDFFHCENGFREWLYKQYLSKGAFPNERIIGVATDSLYAAFLQRYHKQELYPGVFPSGDDYKQDYELLAKYALSVMIHSKCSFWKYRDALWQAVLNGYLQPKEYALLEITSLRWNQHNDNSWDDCQPQPQKHDYFILPEEKRDAGTDSTRLAQAEQNRAAIYMQSYAVDEQKKLLQRETGLWFFYDFVDRPN